MFFSNSNRKRYMYQQNRISEVKIQSLPTCISLFFISAFFWLSFAPAERRRRHVCPATTTLPLLPTTCKSRQKETPSFHKKIKIIFFLCRVFLHMKAKQQGARKTFGESSPPACLCFSPSETPREGGGQSKNKNILCP